MEIHSTIKDTPALVVSGIIFLVIFGPWLKRNFHRFDFSQKFGTLFFILDNYELVGALLIGIGLILIAIFA